MKKFFQKVAAIFMAAVLVFFAIPAGTTAYANKSTGTITITKTADGAEYNIYKIFSLTIGENDAYIYTANENWVEFLNTCYVYTNNDVDIFITSSDENWSSVSEKASALFTLNESGVLSVDSAIFNYKSDDDSDVLKDFAEAVVDYAEINTINANYTLPVTEGEEEPSYSVDVDYGWYVVDSSLGTLLMVDNVDDSTVEINEKNGTPTIEKWITEDQKSDDTSDNNDEVTFIIDIRHIANTSYLVLHDALPEEMTLEESSIVVTLFASESDTSGTALTETTDYTLNTSPSCSGTTDVSCTFEIKFEDETLADLGNDAHIQMKYSVTVNTKNDAYVNNTDELINYAQLTYGTTGKTPVVEAKDELFGIEIVKYAYTIGTDTDYANALSGATFTLTNSEGKTAYFTKDASSGVYYFEEWVASGSTPTDTGYTYEVVSGTYGKITIEGLDAGSYTLTEKVAPDGYKLLKSSITVTITYSEGTPSWTWSYDLGEDSGSSSISGSDSTIYIGNLKGGMLAGTGGIGTTIFYIVGGVIIVAAIILFITRKRMERAEKNK